MISNEIKGEIIMHRIIALAAVMACIGGIVSFAQPAHSQTVKKPTHKSSVKAKPKKTAEVKYKAACGMIYSAADAKKYHYICPMDHKPLVKIAAKAKK